MRGIPHSCEKPPPYFSRKQTLAGDEVKPVTQQWPAKILFATGTSIMVTNVSQLVRLHDCKLFMYLTFV